LECSQCGATVSPDGIPTVCPNDGAPFLVRYQRETPDRRLKETFAGRPETMWRFREPLPPAPRGEPVAPGGRGTPPLPAERLGAAIAPQDLWIKDEAPNPTGSFKARGLAAAITRAVLAGARSFVLPTAGNAGVAAAAYGARAGAHVRVYAPRTTPEPLLAQM